MDFPFFRTRSPPSDRASLSELELPGTLLGLFQTITKTRFLRRRDALWPGRSPLLKTFSAIHRASLCRLEGNGCFFSALRTHRLGLDTLHAAGTCRCARRAIGFARLAPLGLVLEALVGEKHLLAGGENELSRTFSTLQNPVMVFHTLLQELCRNRSSSGTVLAGRMRARARKIHASLTPTGRTI
jgi:hypothetical protein